MTDRTGRPNAPFRIDLDQQKKRAKELLRGARAGDPVAAARLRAQHPEGEGAEPARLADAQFVVARELGAPSWPRLKAHVGAMRAARDAIGRDAAPDADMRTLHLRCGSDIRATLAEAGFVGDFQEHSDPHVQGPVTDGPDRLARRARFIVGAYGAALGLDEAGVAARLAREEDGLARAAAYERVVLWCEHDGYDQLALARWLAVFARVGAPAVLELVSIDRFPGAARFIGLGQLPPEGIRLLWPTRRRLTAADLDTGRRVWGALCADDPRPLATLDPAAFERLPDLPGALRRHLRELPWTRDGLSLTERLTLSIVEAEGPTIGDAFARLTREREPLPFLGDVMFLAVVDALARAREPVLGILDPDLPWPRRRLAVTAAGRAVLRGERDALTLGPPERWVGGVRIAPGEPAWRWDEAASRPVRS